MGSDLTDGDSLQGVIIPDKRLTFGRRSRRASRRRAPTPAWSRLTAPHGPRSRRAARPKTKTRSISAPCRAESPDRRRSFRVAHGRGRELARMGRADLYRRSRGAGVQPSATQGYYRPSIVALSDGTLIVAADNPSSTKHRVRVRVRARRVSGARG